METNSHATHTLGSQSPQSAAPTPIDYTELTEGVPIEGHLSNGIATESTARCPKCNRIGVMSVKHEGSRIVVHRGIINGDSLDGSDYCEVIIASEIG